jgi:hypothetical protein
LLFGFVFFRFYDRVALFFRVSIFHLIFIWWLSFLVFYWYPLSGFFFVSVPCISFFGFDFLNLSFVFVILFYLVLCFRFVVFICSLISVFSMWSSCLFGLFDSVCWF